MARFISPTIWCERSAPLELIAFPPVRCGGNRLFKACSAMDSWAEVGHKQLWQPGSVTCCLSKSLHLTSESTSGYFSQLAMCQTQTRVDQPPEVAVCIIRETSGSGRMGDRQVDESFAYLSWCAPLSLYEVCIRDINLNYAFRLQFLCA